VHVLGNRHNLIVIKIQARDGKTRSGVTRLLLDARYRAVLIKIHHTVALRILDLITENQTALSKSGYITIASLTQPRWESIVKTMGDDYAWLLEDPRAATVSTRCTEDNAPFIHKVVEEWVMAQDSIQEAEKLMEANGVPCLRTRSIKELADNDEHIKAREMMVEVEQPYIGKMKMYGSPLKMSETPCGPRGHGPLLGEHTEEILAHTLGYTKEQVEELYSNNILHIEEAAKSLVNQK